jgi:hypothetical protein
MKKNKIDIFYENEIKNHEFMKLFTRTQEGKYNFLKCFPNNYLRYHGLSPISKKYKKSLFTLKPIENPTLSCSYSYSEEDIEKINENIKKFYTKKQ